MNHFHLPHSYAPPPPLTLVQVEIMSHLSHPNIVLFMGACLDATFANSEWVIVSEYLPRVLYANSCQVP